MGYIYNYNNPQKLCMMRFSNTVSHTAFNSKTFKSWPVLLLAQSYKNTQSIRLTTDLYKRNYKAIFFLKNNFTKQDNIVDVDFVTKSLKNQCSKVTIYKEKN